ncbi:hypothetical protein AJ78_03354 [Emergomyces pasteurianus Ep9510]|uniref:Uncharacterized protein n=1 Tax=Emergomyces pasteurianus Ep9510 TaxID=1447872 RepID=A0A1J9Q8F6_9EURO|nr:hypothetical protein AJ78_03354 [Emergomyces pasteurianus Ep9510]
MKIATAFIVILSLTLDVVSNSIFIKRDVNHYLTVLHMLVPPLQELNDALESRDLQNIVLLGPKMDDALRDGLESLRLDVPLPTVEDSLLLRSPLEELEFLAYHLVNLLIGLKDLFISAGIGDFIREILKRLHSGFLSLCNLLSARVSPEVEHIIEDLCSSAVLAYQRGIDAYNTTPTSTTISPTPSTTSTSTTTIP